MREAVLGYWMLGSLVAHVAAHLALVVAVARARGPVRAAAALVLTPLAALWGWEAGQRRWTVVWLGGLAGWAMGIGAAMR
jgi:hypothetical protein